MRHNGRKKILLIIPSLAGGGAERVCIDLIRALRPEQYDVSLVLFDKKGEYLPEVPAHVGIHVVQKRTRYDIFRLVVGLALLLRYIRPDTAVSFMSYPSLVLVLAKIISFTRIRIVISIHNYLSIQLQHDRCMRLKIFLFRIFFKIASVCFVPSEGVKKDMATLLKMKEDKIVVIRNPVNLARIRTMKDEACIVHVPSKYIVAVGRLSLQKGYRYLLNAYSGICNGIEEDLVIVGTGEQEHELKDLAKKLNIGERVIFLGFQANPYVIMKKSSALVLSSEFESFALVIVEAMACGTPVISTDCPAGPSEIIDDGVDGILVPVGDEKKLADAILALLKNNEMRQRLSAAGLRKVSNFSIEKILPDYEKLFY